MFFPFFVSPDELKERCAYFSRIPWEVKSGAPLRCALPYVANY